MDFLSFDTVSFTYPAVEGDIDENGRQIIPHPVFDHFTGSLPGGFVSLVGPNGAGKSTFIMLASGRLEPDNGTVTLLGKNPQNIGENEKNLLASVIYQNMEFESKDKTADLLAYVYQNGALKGKAAGIRTAAKNGTSSNDLLAETIDIFELAPVLSRGLNELSKGELQRVLLAFSLLYGSASVFMDEPLFAMEYPQKERALSYLREFVHKTGTSIYISMHELELTRRFADSVLLFYPNRDMSFGTPEEVLTNEDLEKAYGVPATMLKDGEEYTRKNLRDTSDAIKDMNERAGR
jgi:iron complex transport system ATP-binding protein